jgi:transcriptional regulator with XRE-family HTH domain
MTDTKQLKSVMVAKGITLKELAEKIGISRTSLSYKINNKVEFTSSEVAKIQKALNMSVKLRDLIFFAKEVD